MEPVPFTMTILILFIARSLISEFFEIFSKTVYSTMDIFFFHSNWKKTTTCNYSLTLRDLVPECTNSEPGRQEGSLGLHSLQLSASLCEQ